MSDTERSVFWICVILTMVMAFTAMMIALPRVCDIHSNINFDYQTMIVTILGVFIASLIGWQIWATINANHIIDRFDNRIHTTEASVERLEQQRQLLETQDQRGRNLIEAFAEARKGDAESILSAKYMCYLNSICLFISANVPAAYQYLTQVELDLSKTLNLLEHSTDRASQRMFIDRINDYENIYLRIITLIHQRQEDLEALHSRITHYRDERRRISAIIQGQQTSNP